MAILKIARMGHPILLTQAAEVADPTAPEIARLIENMAETLEDAGGVGLAAPQVHESLRLFIYKVPGERAEAGGAEIALRVVINPVITPVGDQVVMGWEGCLSIPGLRAAVPRYESVRLRGVDASGAKLDEEISGFHARVVQHEADHLDGVMYPMRMADFRYFGFTEEVTKFDFPLPAISLSPVAVKENVDE